MFEVHVIGNVVKDVELRSVKVSGKPRSVIDVKIAVNYGYGDHKQVSYLSASLWDARAEGLAKYLKKGKKVAINAKGIAPRTYESKTAENGIGVELVLNSPDIELIGSKLDDGEAAPVPAAKPKANYTAQKAEPEPVDIIDEEAPF